MEKELSILDVLYSAATMDERIHGYTRITVERAMKEYASQQSKKEAILFAEWCSDENYIYTSNGKWVDINKRERKTTDQLYQLFKDNSQTITLPSSGE